jgi:hypothetical protein
MANLVAHWNEQAASRVRSSHFCNRVDSVGGALLVLAQSSTVSRDRFVAGAVAG